MKAESVPRRKQNGNDEARRPHNFYRRRFLAIDRPAVIARRGRAINRSGMVYVRAAVRAVVVAPCGIANDPGSSGTSDGDTRIDGLDRTPIGIIGGHTRNPGKRCEREDECLDDFSIHVGGLRFLFNMTQFATLSPENPALRFSCHLQREGVARGAW